MDNGFIIFFFVVIIEVTVIVLIWGEGGVGIFRGSQYFLHLIVLHFRPCLSQPALVVVRHIASKLWLLIMSVPSTAAILLLLGLVWLMLLVLSC